MAGTSMRLARRAVALALGAGLVAACNDGSRGITAVPVQPPLGSVPAGSHVVRGEVDDSGNVTFSPLQDGSSDFAPGIDGNVYGRQNVDVRVYAKAATVTTQSGITTWTMLLGVRNLEPYPIGGNQAGAVPTDTSGIFLGFVGGPTVTRTSGSCPSPCTMSITSYDGVGTFTAARQPYLYWAARLAAVQPLAGADTVSKRRQVQFTSPSEVTDFVFYMLIDADWPPPAQTTWGTTYTAATDGFPDSTAGVGGQHAAPRWKQATQKPSLLATESWSTSVFSINALLTTTYYLYRRDSLSSATDAFMQVNVNVTGTDVNPETVFGFLDGARMVAVGLTNKKLSFVSYGGLPPAAQVVGTAQSYATGAHTITLHKYKADSAVVDVDGQRTLSIPYSSLPVSPSQSFTFTSAPAEFFGSGSITGTATSKWTLVAYGIGLTQP